LPLFLFGFHFPRKLRTAYYFTPVIAVCGALFFYYFCTLIYFF